MYFTKNAIAVVLILSLWALILPSVLPTLTRMSVVGVVYAEGNVPVKGATVTVTGSNCSGVGTTDSTGSFRITSGLGTGTCSVTVTAPGYLDKVVSNVQVTAGSTVTVPGISLSHSGMISGIVASLSFPSTPPPPG